MLSRRQHPEMQINFQIAVRAGCSSDLLLMSAGGYETLKLSSMPFARCDISQQRCADRTAQLSQSTATPPSPERPLIKACAVRAVCNRSMRVGVPASSSSAPDDLLVACFNGAYEVGSKGRNLS
jgi:hypothetical protein